MFAAIVERVPQPVEDVDEVVRRVGLLPAWNELFVAVTPTRPTLEPSSRFDAVIRPSRSESATSWTVERVVRRIYHLRGRDGQGCEARLVLSASPWDGGSAIALSFDADRAFATGRGLGAVDARLRRRLRRSVDHLAVLVNQDPHRRVPRPVPVPALVRPVVEA